MKVTIVDRHGALTDVVQRKGWTACETLPYTDICLMAIKQMMEAYTDFLASGTPKFSLQEIVDEQLPWYENLEFKHIDLLKIKKDHTCLPDGLIYKNCRYDNSKGLISANVYL